MTDEDGLAVYTEWNCGQGHTTRTFLIRGGATGLIGGSGWDYCDICSESPGRPESIRMMREALEQARAKGMISRAEYERRSDDLAEEERAAGVGNAPAGEPVCGTR